MFEGNEIINLVELFAKRGVKLYHSAQYQDFLTYLELGGIPSRSLIEKHNLKMTKFISDENDQINNVWDKVFLNPLDFGDIFKRGNGIPNVYGPISFVFTPHALLNANNVAICLRSAGCKEFNREEDTLKSINDVKRIFAYEYSDDPHYFFENSIIKFKKYLKKDFKMDYVSDPEISLDIKNNLLGFAQYLLEVIVDPYNIDGILLVNKVSRKINEYNVQTSVKERNLSGISSRILPEIVNILKKDLPALFELENYSPIDSELSDWASRMREKRLGQQWLNYGQYLREGTLFPIIEEEDIIRFNH